MTMKVLGLDDQDSINFHAFYLQNKLQIKNKARKTALKHGFYFDPLTQPEKFFQYHAKKLIMEKVNKEIVLTLKSKQNIGMMDF